MADFERAKAAGTNRLDDGDVYEPGLEADASTQILGGANILGGSSSSVPSTEETREERRRRILNATARRLEQQYGEIEDMCPGSK